MIETVFNSIQEGIIVTDADGRITYVNDAACDFFGVDGEKSIGKRLDERVRGLDWKSFSPSGGPSRRDMEIFYPCEQVHQLLHRAVIDRATVTKGKAAQRTAEYRTGRATR